MAGTRLLLSIVFLIEIPLLVIIALWSAVNSSKDKPTKWHPDHQPFLPNRRGLDVLHKYNFARKMAELQEMNVASSRPSFNVDVFLYGAEQNSQDAMFQTLNQSIHESLIQSKLSYNIDVRVSSDPKRGSSSLDLPGERNCKTTATSSLSGSSSSNTAASPWAAQEALQNSYNPISSPQDYSTGYIPVILAIGCKESKVYVTETGSVTVTFHNNISHNDIFHLLKTRVSDVIHRQLTMSVETLNQMSQRNPSSAYSKVILSLVDPDPSSHAVRYQDAIEHTQRLNRALVNVTKEYVIPFMAKLAEYSNLTLYTQNLPYHGQDVLSHVRKNEYTDDTVDYTLSTMDARKVLLDGDLAHYTQGFVPPYVEEGFGSSEDCCDKVMHFLMYVAKGDMTPMYVLDEIDNRWSTAFALPDRNLAISIMNFAQDLDLNKYDRDGNKNVTEDYAKDGTRLPWTSLHELDDLYHSQVQSSFAFLATYLRQYFGLLSPQPHLMDSITDSIASNSKEEQLPVYRERPKDGVAQWEVDLLIRNTIHFKITHILESLEKVYALIEIRHAISVSDEVSVTAQNYV